MNKKKKILDISILLTCMLVLAILTFRIVFKIVNTADADYIYHTECAIRFWEVVPQVVSYPMWHFGVYIVYSILGIVSNTPDASLACAIFTTIANLIVYLCIRYTLKLEKVKAVDIIALLLCVVQPIYWPRFNPNLYLGQGSPVTWHNPANLMVKPFVMLAFIYLIIICDKIRKNQKVLLKERVILSIIIFFSVLAKPSFFQGVVPSLGVYIILALIIQKGKGFWEYVKLCISFVPGFLVVIYQFFSNFDMSTVEGGVGFKYGVNGVFTNNIYISLLLVIMFPLFYTLLNIKKMWYKTETHLVWCFVCIAWLESATLYETGPRMADGNFSWAVQLAYTVVWVYQLKNFALDIENAKSIKEVISLKNMFLMVLLLYHLYSGILYCRQLLYIPGVVF